MCNTITPGYKLPFLNKYFVCLMLKERLSVDNVEACRFPENFYIHSRIILCDISIINGVLYIFESWSLRSIQVRFIGSLV
jgi:hypothetical protein